jgi:hypothetical protein
VDVDWPCESTVCELFTQADKINENKYGFNRFKRLQTKNIGALAQTYLTGALLNICLECNGYRR